MPKTGRNFFLKLQKCARPAALLAGAALMLAGNAASADEVFTARTAISLPGTQKVTAFDISFVDPVIGLYLLADRTNAVVDVIDTTTNTVLVQLMATPPFAGAVTQTVAGVTKANNNLSGPDGVVTVNHREIWAGDGPQNTGGTNPQPIAGTSSVKVIDLFSQKTTHVINTGGTFRADELCFDPRDQLVLVANDAESPFPFVSFISTANYSVLKRITMDGTIASGGKVASPKATNGIEQCQWDRRTGKFYVNIPEVNGPGNDTAPGAVVTLSPDTLEIENVFSIPIGKCAGPQGMAIGPDHQILLGCNDPNKTVPSTVVIDDHNGNVIATIANEDGADEVDFNEGDDQYFLARSGGANPQKLGIIDAEGRQADQDVTTGTAGAAGTAHSVASDPVSNQVYVPIPSTAGSTVCSGTGTPGASDAQGCIAVFTAAHDDQQADNDRHGR